MDLAGLSLQVIRLALELSLALAAVLPGSVAIRTITAAPDIVILALAMTGLNHRAPLTALLR